ncbi:uncharacterized protein LOC121421858 [Lytechinus variegatus]|uniref:uncharacterized protein LOC121421858 n=1 Tax=Lytechinus variegatus TaxID=7654 RepID=UPI001BB139AB|nr:uncharacterized protein LOC121421858 [Lytechinus variegatus]
MDYKNSAVDWANFLRDHCRKFVHDLYYELGEKLRGEVEIDESLFGRRTKYHRGDPRNGRKIYQQDCTLPVERRDENTLLPLIERHVEKGSTIYSDGWRAYYRLNEIGYRHFTVEHSDTFVQKYRDTTTGEATTVHTNTIEGAWKSGKDHFRRMNGCKASTFESHLCEVIWRNRNAASKRPLIPAFMDLIRDHYHLRGKPNLCMKVPLFDTWHADKKDKLMREELTGDTPVRIDSPPRASPPLSPRDVPGPSGIHPQAASSVPSSPSIPTVKRVLSPSSSIASPFRATSPSYGRSKKGKGKKKRKSDTVTGTLHHPPGFVPIDKKGKAKLQKDKSVNVYDRQNFVADWGSDDDDFQ